MSVFNPTKTLVASCLVFFQCFAGVPMAFADDPPPPPAGYQDLTNSSLSPTVAPSSTPATSTAPQPVPSAPATTTNFLEGGALSSNTTPETSVSTAPQPSAVPSEPATNLAVAVSNPAPVPAPSISATPSLSDLSSATSNTPTSSSSVNDSESAPSSLEQISSDSKTPLTKVYENTKRLDDLVINLNKINARAAIEEGMLQIIPPEDLNLSDNEKADFTRDLLEALQIIQETLKLSEKDKLSAGFLDNITKTLEQASDYFQFSGMTLEDYEKILPALKGVADTTPLSPENAVIWMRAVKKTFSFMSPKDSDQRDKILKIMGETFDFMKNRKLNSADDYKVYIAWEDTVSEAVSLTDGTDTALTDKAADQLTQITGAFLDRLHSENFIGNANLQVQVLSHFFKPWNRYSTQMRNFLWSFFTDRLDKAIGDLGDSLKDGLGEYTDSIALNAAMYTLNRIGKDLFDLSKKEEAYKLHESLHDLWIVFLDKALRSPLSSSQGLTITSYALESYIQFTESLFNQEAWGRVLDVLRAFEGAYRAVPVYLRSSKLTFNLDFMNSADNTSLTLASLNERVPILVLPVNHIAIRINDDDAALWTKSLLMTHSADASDLLRNMDNFVEELDTAFASINDFLRYLDEGEKTYSFEGLKTLGSLLTPADPFGNPSSTLGFFIASLTNGAFSMGDLKEKSEKLGFALYEKIVNQLTGIFPKIRNLDTALALQMTNTVSQLALPLMRTACKESLGACESVYTPLRQLYALALSSFRNQATGPGEPFRLSSEIFINLTQARDLVADSYIRNYGFPATDELGQSSVLNRIVDLQKEGFEDFDLYLRQVSEYSKDLGNVSINNFKANVEAHLTFVQRNLTLLSGTTWQSDELKNDFKKMAQESLTQTASAIKNAAKTIALEESFASLLDKFNTMVPFFRNAGVNTGSTYKTLLVDLNTSTALISEQIQKAASLNRPATFKLMEKLASDIASLTKNYQYALMELKKGPEPLDAQSLRDAIYDAVTECWTNYRNLLSTYKIFIAMDGADDAEFISFVQGAMSDASEELGNFLNGTLSALLVGIDDDDVQFRNCDIEIFKIKVGYLGTIASYGLNLEALADDFGANFLTQDFLELTQQ